MKFTGERLVPDDNAGDFIFTDHITRYLSCDGCISGKRIVDAGCGAGYGSYLLSIMNAKTVVGFDLSLEAINYANDHYKNAPLHYCVASARNIPFNENSFDVAVAFEILEHVEFHDDFIRELKRILVPQGQLVISTPNPEIYKSANAFHIKELSTQDFLDLLRKHFRHVRTYYQNEQICSLITAATSENSSVKKKLCGPLQPGSMNLHPHGTYPASGRYNIAVCSDAEPFQLNEIIVLNAMEFSRMQNQRLEFTERIRVLDKRIEELRPMKHELIRLKQDYQRIEKVKNTFLFKFFLFLSRLKRSLWG